MFLTVLSMGWTVAALAVVYDEGRWKGSLTGVQEEMTYGMT